MAATIIGRTLVIDGEVHAEEDLLVQGTVKGRVVVKQNVDVEAGALVEADVEGGTVTISGQVAGNVTAADRLEVRSEGRLVGDVRAGRIMFSDGASFKGNVDMDL